jgi:HAD superfamily hydrolase (TIGR01490 family)
MRRYAFFDLDGTLLPHDTQLLFANHVLRREPWRRALLLPFLAALPLAGVRLLRSRGMKRLFCGYLAGMAAENLDRHAREFAEKTVPAACFPEMLAEVERHRAEGRILILNTASPVFYATHIARVLGFDHCVATRVVVPARMPLVPQIDGPNNKRSAKLAAMVPLLPDSFNPVKPEPFPDSYAYSDSIVDLPLLACAEHKVTVNPRGKLREMAAGGGWRVVDLQGSYTSPAAHRLAGLQQLFGVFPEA